MSEARYLLGACSTLKWRAWPPGLGDLQMAVALVASAAAQMPTATAASAAQASDRAAAAAIHPVSTMPQMQAWLARVPRTRDFPSDFEQSLRGEARLFVIEMTTTPNCLPCGHMWSTLSGLRSRYAFELRTISREQALLRSGALGLPWVGHPVAWVRPVGDEQRTVPIAVGADHGVNLARNIYLAFKMLAGVRPAVGLRAMAKFTGIVGATVPRRPATQKQR